MHACSPLASEKLEIQDERWVADGVSENSLSPLRSRPWVVSVIRFGRGVIGGDGGCEVEVPVSTGCAWESRVLLDLIMVSAPILLRRLQTVHPSLLMTLTRGLVPSLL